MISILIDKRCLFVIKNKTDNIIIGSNNIEGYDV